MAFNGHFKTCTIILYLFLVMTFKVIQGCWFWHQSKARRWLPIATQ